MSDSNAKPKFELLVDGTALPVEEQRERVKKLGEVIDAQFEEMEARAPDYGSVILTMDTAGFMQVTATVGTDEALSMLGSVVNRLTRNIVDANMAEETRQHEAEVKAGIAAAIKKHYNGREC